MSTDELDILPKDGRTGRRPGETVVLSAMWALGRKPKAVEARLFWFTQGRGIEDIMVVATQAVPSPAEAGEQEFTFTLPEAPYSCAGQLVSIKWAVELVADGEAARWEFMLGPEGREIALDSGGGTV